jgi:hypothetical protein
VGDDAWLVPAAALSAPEPNGETLGSALVSTMLTSR